MMSLITGPSRTGDIERVLVLGAHGQSADDFFAVNQHSCVVSSPGSNLCDAVLQKLFGKYARDASLNLHLLSLPNIPYCCLSHFL